MLKGINMASIVPAGWQSLDLVGMDYYASKGFNCVRLSIHMETMFASPGAEMNKTALALLQTHVDHAQKLGMTVILDFHNFAMFYGKQLGDPGYSYRALADACQRLAGAFKTCRINIQNEPVGNLSVKDGKTQPARAYLALTMTACTSAIRSAGNYQPVHFSAPDWGGRAAFKAGSTNFDWLTKVWDSIVPQMLDWHCYPDWGGSGQEGNIETGWLNDVQAVVDWRRKQPASAPKFFMGEFAWRPDQNAEGAKLMAIVNGAPDVFSGWCWWGNDPSRVGYSYRLQPGAEWWDDTASAEQRAAGPYVGPDKSQLAILMK